MSIEPTEDQKQAAAAFVARHGEQNEVIDSGGQARLDWSPTHTVNDIARLLAEREAKLQGELARLHKLFDDAGGGEYNVLALVDHYQKEALGADTLRARVAELEKDLYVESELNGVLMEREAQHLADIKALREALGQGYALSLNERDRVLKATAHYDDAHDTEGGEG